MTTTETTIIDTNIPEPSISEPTDTTTHTIPPEPSPAQTESETQPEAESEDESTPRGQRQRRGKIARLPKAIRQELNLRMQNGETGAALAEWLNGLPAVKDILTAQFHDAPIREQNISQWRKGGFVDWERAEEARLSLGGVEEEITDLKGTSPEGLAHRLSFYMAAQLALQMRRVAAMPDDDAKVKALRELTASLVSLRRGDLQAERILLQREIHKLKHMTKEERMAEFWKWADDEVNRDEFCRRRCFTAEQRQERINKILGITPGWKPKIYSTLVKPEEPRPAQPEAACPAQPESTCPARVEEPCVAQPEAVCPPQPEAVSAPKPEISEEIQVNPT